MRGIYLVDAPRIYICWRPGNGPTFQPTDRPTESDRKRPQHPTEKVCKRDDSVPCLSKKFSMIRIRSIDTIYFFYKEAVCPCISTFLSSFYGIPVERFINYMFKEHFFRSFMNIIQIKIYKWAVQCTLYTFPSIFTSSQFWLI